MINKQITKSSSNVFADIGVNKPDEALVKAKLAHVIAQVIDVKGLTQSEAAELLGIDQPKVSNLVRGKLSGFSIDRLFRFLTLLGSDIEILVKQGAKSKPGHMKVAVA